MSGVKTSVTELPESRVRVEAEVPAAEIERRVQQAAAALGRELRVPGFRKGKVPPPVVLRRVGREAVLDEAVRDSLPSWYSDAIDSAGVSTVGEPDVDLGDLPGEGQALTFSIEIGVRPPATLGAYKGLEVNRRTVEVAEEKVDEELEQLRDRVAKLESVERAANDGDWVVMDYSGTIDGEPFAGGQGTDQLIGLGTGRLVPGFEKQLEGSSAGDERTIEVTFPEDYRNADLAGRDAIFEVAIKDVRTRVLPELDDDFAADAAGFDTIEELREELRGRLAHADEHAIEVEYRTAVLDAVVAEATIEVPETLVDARAEEMWQQMMSSLRRQGIPKETYLQIAGKEEAEIVAEAKPDAAQALRRDAVLAAVVEAEREALAPTREELLAALEAPAEEEKTTAEKVLTKLERAGKADPLIEEISMRKALDLLVESAVAVGPGAGAAPHEHHHEHEDKPKLWTPDQDAEKPRKGAKGKLWTPGS